MAFPKENSGREVGPGLECPAENSLQRISGFQTSPVGTVAADLRLKHMITGI